VCEREGGREGGSVSVCVCVYIYIKRLANLRNKETGFMIFKNGEYCS
jgi:hypothetical protein